MLNQLADRVIEKIAHADELFHRLIMLVAVAGVGKTAALRDVHLRTTAPLVNISLESSRRMLDLTERQRTLQLPRLLAEIVDMSLADAHANENEPTRYPGLILLDNIEVLFDISLQQDPMRLLQGLSRNRTIVAALSGSIEGDSLIYAAPDHPEYRRYPIKEFLIVHADISS